MSSFLFNFKKIRAVINASPLAVCLSLVSSKGYWRNAWKVNLNTYEENDIAGFSTPWTRLDRAAKKDVKAVTSHVVLKSLK